jgi:hypothetical protein
VLAFSKKIRNTVKPGAIVLLGGVLCLLIFRAFQPSIEGEREAAVLVQRLRWPENFAEARALIQQLEAIGEPSLAPLLETLESPHGDEFYILDALKGIGQPSVAPLIHFVESHESFLSFDDWGLTSRLPRWIQSYILNPSDESSIKKSAYRLLVEIAPSDQTVLDLLIQGTGDDYEINRVFAILFMGKMDDRFESQIVSTLAQHTSDPSRVVRHRVATILGQFAETSASAHETLVILLNDTDPYVRRVAAKVIGETGNVDEPTYRKLLSGLKDKDSGFRVACAGALWRLGRDREAAMGVFEDQLRDRIELSRTLKELEAIGPDMIGLVEEIESLFEHADDTFRVLAARSHWALTGEDSRLLSNLDKVINTSNNRGQSHAVGSLGLLGPKAREIIPSVIEVARNDSHLMLEAIHAFEKIGPPATEAIPFIEEALNHRAPFIQKAAHEALTAIRASAGDE